MQRMAERPQATLLLQDGTVMRGKTMGRKGSSGGELCFNTGMTGYQEIYTDPSYYGQMIIHTMPHIGNYGVAKAEVESDSVKIAGMICGSFSPIFSRLGALDGLDNYLAENGIVGISEIDTRKLVRHIRHAGAMNALISSESADLDFLREKLNQIPPMESLELASRVMTRNVYHLGPDSGKKVAVLDYGIKQNMLRSLVAEGFQCLVFPGDTPPVEILKSGADAIFISNGPGDPAVMDNAVSAIQTLLKTGLPLFGICLGHQLLARAYGLPTYKMKNGHRGLNHPVKNLITGHCEITSQNHGFAVSSEALENHPDLMISHINLNDGTVEGIRAKHQRAFSVQYHPEACPGPHDAAYLFADFRNMVNTG